mgnify:CR=1 FL=1|jgi:hypothetical protein
MGYLATLFAIIVIAAIVKEILNDEDINRKNK